jgi:hypothetical protein
MKAIGVIANCGKPQAREVLARVQLKAAELGLRLYTDDAAAARLLPGARLVVTPPAWRPGSTPCWRWGATAPCCTPPASCRPPARPSWA